MAGQGQEKSDFLRERKPTMTWGTTGALPTQYDPTTNAMLHSIARLGTTDEEIREDVDYWTEMWLQVGKRETIATGWVEAMDLSFIGLLYHRHMPYRASEAGELIRPQKGTTDYPWSLSKLSTGLIMDPDAECTPEDIMAAATDAAMLMTSHFEQPSKADTAEGLELQKQVLACGILGLIVHRHLPKDKY